eukprot:TRINITY_DN2864_c0_g1_i13.p1 TRINITY_DN2864_c0_g1~~TRINITY_DN2864_c0_g1_i13.p1  ORF type:complete len:165 (-),score=24.05 TRINITY_DN2864_c0_g1_i13:186-680(-)
MPNVKLTYFDLRARAEPCRLLLAYAGTKYEDERLAAPWDNMAPWAALKPNTPWGQVPLLAWDGEIIAQSMACARFLAREFNLAGRTSMEMARSGRDHRCDSRSAERLGILSTMPTDTAGQQKYLGDRTIPPGRLAQLERSWRAGRDSSWWGSAFSWADLHLSST